MLTTASIYSLLEYLLQEEIFVARAPGRLDVMGGIADYSGSLVLQVNILSLLVPSADLFLS